MTTTIREPALVPVAPSVVTEADVLRRAADLLEEFGWCQGEYGSKQDEKFCAVGACWEAKRELGLDVCGDEYLQWPESALGLADVPPWNDDPARTKEEVIARIRAAAERAA